MSDFVHDPLETCLQELSHLFIHISRLKEEESYEEKRGGFGDVGVSVLDPDTPEATLVAVKMIRLRGGYSEPKRLALRLARELKVWAGLSHPHILPLLGYYLDIEYKTAILISEYMTCGDLKDYIDREDPPFNTRLGFVRDYTDGLAYLHTRSPPVRHGDLKMGNILVTEQRRAILSDFGISRALDGIPSGLSTSSCLGGTLRYCCPELVQDSDAERSLPNDIWAWGCTVLETLTGMIPYDNLKSESALILAIMQGQLPANTEILQIPVPEIKTLLAQCWITEPDRRPTASDALHTLEATVLNLARMATTPSASHQSPTEHFGGANPSLDAETPQSRPCGFDIFDDLFSEAQSRLPRLGRKRSNSEPADAFEPRKKPRLTLQDELHANRAAEFVAARQSVTVEEALDSLEQSLHNYRAVTADCSKTEENGRIKFHDIRLPTIQSLSQMFDPGLTSLTFFPSDIPDNAVPGLESTSTISQSDPRSPVSPIDEVDKWWWPIDSTQLASDTTHVDQACGLAGRLPVHDHHRTLAKREGALQTSSDVKEAVLDEDGCVEIARDRQPFSEDGWRWDREMEPNGEWAIKFQRQAAECQRELQSDKNTEGVYKSLRNGAS